MSVEKRVQPGFLTEFPGKMEVTEYIYTPGLSGVEFAKALRNGRIVGSICKSKVHVPPRTFCADDYSKEQGFVDLTNKDWFVVTYTIIYADFYGNPLGKPKVVAVLKPREVEGGLIHYVDVDPNEIKIGMCVRPVFRSDKERKGLITDIKYFKPC